MKTTWSDRCDQFYGLVMLGHVVIWSFILSMALFGAWWRS